MRSRAAAAVLTVSLQFTGLLACIPVSHAQEGTGVRQDRPVLFRADQLRNEQNVGVLVATGNVEFTQGERTLLADTVTYNRRTDVVIASGHVSLLEPTGEVIFADHVELTGDLRSGIVENIRIRLLDDARLAGAGGRRVDGNRTELNKGVYSACKPCEEDPSSAPIWQLKAIEVIHDQTTRDIQYKDAYLEFYGLPVLYTPYLSHPDPTVKRRTGLLSPVYGGDSELGLNLTTPYYFDIAPEMDATFSPIIPANEGAVAAGEFRHRLRDGEYILDGSITSASDGTSDTESIRGHIKGTLRYDMNPTWRGGADMFLATDDTYLRRYHFSSPDTLENRLYAEGFRQRNYLAANAYYFQGQRAGDDQGQTPIVFPMIDYNYVGEPDAYGGNWIIDANMLALTRTGSNATQTRRVSVKPQWELPYTSPLGEVYRAYASVQTDAYWITDVEESDAPSNTISGVTGRVFPQAGLDWRLPFVRREGRVSQIVEPMLGFVVAPPSQNHDLIPNEDSVSLEFDETNLFSSNRFSGIDRVEGGPRIVYGLHSGVFGDQGGFSSFFLGQSYRFINDDDFGAGTGLDDHFSDIVGRIRVSPIRYLDALYRFRIDKDDFSAVRNEIQATAGVPAFKLSVNYLSVKQQELTDIVDPDDAFRDREQITVGLSSQVTKSWQVGASTLQDLTDGGSALSRSAYLLYEDDCFQFRTDFTRSYTRDRDIRPSDTIFFRIVLKTLGEFRTSTSAN